jgi:uncharacterized protein with GYD domain
LTATSPQNTSSRRRLRGVHRKARHHNLGRPRSCGGLGKKTLPVRQNDIERNVVAMWSREPPSQVGYTADAKNAFLNQPQDRSGAAREVAESLGGKLLGFWFAFGEFDGIFLLEAPDNAAAAAVGMAVGASGALSDVETTVLLDMDEAQEAMRKAAAGTYRPPGS